MIRLTVVQATLVPERPWILKDGPRLPAAVLRGAMGEALFRLLCLHTGRDCQRCPARGGCLIPNWYDPGQLGGNALRPFVPRVILPRGGRISPRAPLVVDLVLLEPVPTPGVLLRTLKQAATYGLGAERVPHRLDRVEVAGATRVTLVEDGRHISSWPGPGSLEHWLAWPEGLRGARIHVHTPFRPPGKVSGMTADALSERDLLIAAVERVRAVENHQGIANGPFFDLPEPGQWGRWESVERVERHVWSAHQQRKIDLTGFVGTLLLGPQVIHVAPLLSAATVLHVGRQTSYGLGHISVEWLT